MELSADIDLFDADRIRLAPVVEWCKSLQGRSASMEQITIEADDRFRNAGFLVQVTAIADTKTKPVTYYPKLQIVGRVQVQEMDHERRADEVRRALGIDPKGLKDPGKSAIEIEHRH